MSTGIHDLPPGQGPFRLRQLGKRLPRLDHRTLRLSRYIRRDELLPMIAPQVTIDERHGISDWGMHLNDRIGDCTIAAAANLIELWTRARAGTEAISDATVLQAYEAVSGYQPNNPGTDTGAVMLDVLNYWRQTGIAGHRITAYVSLDPISHTEIRQAMLLFGGVYLGLQLPLSAQSDGPWIVPPGDLTGDRRIGSWGGHCVALVASGPTTDNCVTWNEFQAISADFIGVYADEAYAVLDGPDWAVPGTRVPGFDLASLQADLAELGALPADPSPLPVVPAPTAKPPFRAPVTILRSR